ncbi:MAG: DNA-binding protein [Herminiimonas sp.]|nr:DNA-binding protein [Herminiimonas sp.]
MARSGITYSRVAQAATVLIDAGRTPTVDHVREVLGSGSKSTLAPLLKRWKDQHAEAVVAVEAGLPASLLQAVKTVYEGMQHEARQQLAERETEHAVRYEALEMRLAGLLAAHASLQQEHATQSDNLARISSSLQALQIAQQTAAVHASAQASAIHGLEQRLADRARQLAAMTHQLEQTQRQFEHYQEATAQQRSEERQAADQRVRVQELALLALQRQLAAIHESSLQQAGRIAALDAERGSLQERLQQARDQCTAATAERDRWTFLYQEVERARADLGQRVERGETECTRLGSALAAQRQDVMVQQRDLHHAHERIVALEQARVDWLQDKARLLTALRPAAEGTSDDESTSM